MQYFDEHLRYGTYSIGLHQQSLDVVCTFELNYDSDLVLYFGILLTQSSVRIKRIGKVAVGSQIHRIILQAHTTVTNSTVYY